MNDIPSIIKIIHVPEWMRKFDVPVSRLHSLWGGYIELDQLPDIRETIELLHFDGERFHYGYGPSTHTLIIADILGVEP